MKLENNYQSLVEQIKSTYTDGKTKAIKVVRRELVLTYWAVGKHIVEFEQMGNEKSVYGTKILNRLSKDLSDQLGRGFSRTNLISMRIMYLNYPNLSALSDQLSWGHFVELLSLDNKLERSFYEK